MPVRLWDWSEEGLRRRDGAWPTLDALSLELPEGAYTTLRTYGGRRIPGLSHHLQRLADSARLLTGGGTPDLPWVRRGLAEVVRAAVLAETRLRITVPLSCRQVLFGVEPFVPFPTHFFTLGVACRTSHLARRDPTTKSTSFIGRAAQARAAAGPDVQEVLLLDPAGRILEGSSSNFFALVDGDLRTAGTGVLLGVTRALILDLARPLLPVVEEPVALIDLARASEAFISSSSREVMPVVRVDDTVIGDGAPGPVTRELGRRYREHLLAAAEAP